MSVQTLRKWADHGRQSYLWAGDKIVGSVVASEYGTISFTGPLCRGTSKTFADAKKAVEDQFNPENPLSKMLKELSK